MDKALTRFRRTAFAEGISYIVLLFIAMPLKYGLDFPIAVRIVGSIHGALFVAYMLFGLQAALEQKWVFRFWIVVFVASLIPFGTFWLDKKLDSEQSPAL